MTLSNKNYGFSQSLINAVKAVHDTTVEATNPHIEDYSADELAEMIEKYEGFDKVKSELDSKGAKNPGALAAWIGERKYGKKKFEKAAHKHHSLRGAKPVHENVQTDTTTLTENTAKLSFGKDWDMHKLHGSPVHHAEQSEKHKDAWQGILGKIKASRDVKGAEEHLCSVLHDYDKSHDAQASYRKAFGEHPLTKKFYDHRNWEAMHRTYAPTATHRDVVEEVEQLDEISKETAASYLNKSEHLRKSYHALEKATAGKYPKKDGSKLSDDFKKLADNKDKGAARATARLSREEVEELELTPIDEALKHKKGIAGKCVKDCPACVAMKESFDVVIDTLTIDETAKTAIKSHEKKEVKDFDKIQKTLSALKDMHSSKALKKVEEEVKHKIGDKVQVEDNTSRFHGKVGQVTYAADHGAVVDFKDGSSYQPSFRHKDLKGVTEEVAEAVNPGLTASIRQSTNLRQGHPDKVVGVKQSKPKTSGSWAVTEGKLETLKVMLSKKDVTDAADKDVTKTAAPVGQNEETDLSLEEGRGRPRKVPLPAGEEGHEPDQHIVMQLHKSLSSKKPVTFANGKSHHIEGEHATKFLRKYIGSKPSARAALQDHATKSHEHFLDSIKD